MSFGDKKKRQEPYRIIWFLAGTTYISRKGLAHIGIYKGNVKEFGVEIEVGAGHKTK